MKRKHELPELELGEGWMQQVLIKTVMEKQIKEKAKT